ATGSVYRRRPRMTSMTTCAQIPETLVIDDEPLRLCTTPLEAWLHGRRIVAGGCARANCSRGYVGTWELRHARLCLVAVRIPLGGGEPDAQMLAQLFPSSGRLLCADWYSGQLRCPIGALVAFRDSEFDSVYEQDMLIDIACGHVERIAFRHNDELP